MTYEPKLTAREKARVALLTARMVKRCVASEDVDRSDLEKQIDAILDRAREREQQER